MLIEEIFSDIYVLKSPNLKDEHKVSKNNKE